jgi:hypothetical protein
MHKNATKCNKTQSKWCKNKHGASKIIDTFETYQRSPAVVSGGFCGGEAVDGERQSMVITAVASGSSPASQFGGNRQMEAAMVRRHRRAIAANRWSIEGENG